ncbi:hypothetical protein A2960_04885 [Candidatus Gottesmanbacteria bacterium RIFCSPLOWO2_01_FULL_39_12b]|uniref:Aspartokinase n=1 Tax=Candidatus Gottesmanbacteria bacterium RIFCSPLOWO2_01_FULL_39_12b TaxID=1798388 RepID=A0A1F6ANL9_9BACT|nr:MAG: hypothetical protein A2960_04885 [Candidatus Gottesmanbacteria bacterium RIFCSPLOWO2_01_FULL_39_12b]
MKIMKFGGTSVGDGKKILHVAKIVKDYSEEDRVVVVVSAMSGVTDKFISVFKMFKERQHSSGLIALGELYEKHVLALNELGFKNGRYLTIQSNLRNLFGELLTYLSFKDEYTVKDYDHVVSYGERLSCLLVYSALSKLDQDTELVDSAKLIVTTNDFGNAKALLAETEKQVSRVVLPLLIKGVIPIVTGFYGATKDGRIATLGRGGSDYSATILAYALDAQEVILWKEVDGIYSADPKRENGAKFIPELSYRMAAELARNGAKILHPEAMEPVISKKIVIWIKNTFQPEFIGSKIWEGRK